MGTITKLDRKPEGIELIQCGEPVGSSWYTDTPYQGEDGKLYVHRQSNYGELWGLLGVEIEDCTSDVVDLLAAGGGEFVSRTEDELRFNVGKKQYSIRAYDDHLLIRLVPWKDQEGR